MKANFLIAVVTVIVIGSSSLARSQTSVRADRPAHEVLAMYYGWYALPEKSGRSLHWEGVDMDSHQIANSPHYPAGGVYDCTDPAVVDRHIDLARSNGISGFVASWWGRDTFEDESLPVLLAGAEKKNFKASVYWKKAPGEGKEQIDWAVEDLVYLLTRYGTNRAFLKANGKPVIFVYGRVLAQIPRLAWPRIISRARAKAGEFLLIADGYNEDNARQFDGLHNYDISRAADGKRPLQALRAWGVKHDADEVKLAQQRGRISCVTVIPGYDDTKIRAPGRDSQRQAGQVYRVLWEEAIKSKPDWIVIVSWNEWHEGTEIEPSREYGVDYLKLTAEYAPAFLTGKESPVKP